MSMRPIKFRAWDTVESKWLHDYENLGGCDIFGETIILGGWMNGVSLLNFGKVIVDQFTGLHDKNGKEIWEGDVIEELEEITAGRGWKIKKRKGVVIWDEEIAGFMVHGTDKWQSGMGYPAGATNETEVIGNIHENPELLNQS